eukprot:15632-Pleurochrysis_carterae.AAC.1
MRREGTGVSAQLWPSLGGLRLDDRRGALLQQLDHRVHAAHPAPTLHQLPQHLARVRKVERLARHRKVSVERRDLRRAHTEHLTTKHRKRSRGQQTHKKRLAARKGALM